MSHLPAVPTPVHDAPIPAAGPDPDPVRRPRPPRASPPDGGARAGWARAVDGVLDLVLPASCAACGGVLHDEPDAGPAADRVRGHGVCTACLEEVAAARLRAPGGRHASPGLVLRDPPTWAAAEYGGALASLVVAYKDGARRDAVDVLAPLLTQALAAAMRALARAGPAAGPPVVVPAPSRPHAVRARGDRPTEALARAALRAVPRPGHGGPPTAGRPVRALAHGRAVLDQRGLGRSDRSVNLSGALVVPRRAVPFVRGADCVLVDDVCTTGATLADGARALRAAGAQVVVAAVVAAAP